MCVCILCVCFSQVCAEALLKTLELMSKLRQQVRDMETSFYRILQVNNTHTEDSTSIPPPVLHLLLSVLCLWFPHMFALTFLFSVCLPGPENSDSSLSGSDVSSQRSCADWTLSVVWSCVSPRLPLTSVSHSLEIILVGFIKIIWKKKRKEK